MSGKKPKVISLFAGGGGSSLGYKWAGYEEILAIDFYRGAVEIFRANFPEVPIWQRDIREVTGQEILEFCNLKRGELDLLDGSPPCQGFSVAGKREVTDTRNELYKEFIRILNDLEPKVFVMENVKGLIIGHMKGIFKEIMKDLSETNYNVKCKLMNSKYYGVPQDRERLIWIGYRKDLGLVPSFPKPQGRIVTVGEALEGCEVGEYYEPREGTRLKLMIKKLKPGEKASKYHYKGAYFSIKRLKENRPAFTITTEAFKDIIHPREDRMISDRELLRLCSYPDDFILVGGFLDRFEIIGNSVMPRFMEAIARHIKKEVFEREN